MNKPICIMFAAPIGVGKSHISTYLSWKLGLPIFSTNAIRTEVHDDTLDTVQDPQIYRDLVAQRFDEVISLNRTFILDKSIDRTFKETKEKLENAGYDIFVISINLTKELITKMLQTLGYLDTLARIDSIIADHQNFLDMYREEVDLVIDNDNFKDRLSLSLDSVKNIL